MGKRLPKPELLEEIRVERQRLDAMIEPLTPRQMTQAGVTLAGWSIKDILGHVVGWQQLNLAWYAAGLRGETPEVPAPGLSWKDIRKLNDRIYRTPSTFAEGRGRGLPCLPPENVAIDRGGSAQRLGNRRPFRLDRSLVDAKRLRTREHGQSLPVGNQAHPQVAFSDSTMKTQVTFRSDKFPPYDGEEEQINPGLWGKRLAEYLVERLSLSGIKTEPIIAEDWGWYVPIQNERFRLAICCGHQDGDDDEFLCFTDPSTPIVKKLFRKIDATAELTRLTEALEQILSSDADIRDVVWTEL